MFVNCLLNPPTTQPHYANMTKRKLTKRQDDIRRGLTTPHPYDGIHTCSKGCKKAGCNRGLRDTIEEQDAQIVALKQDLLEKTAAVRNLQMGGQCEEISRLKAEDVNLKEVIAELRISAEDDLHSIESARIENTRLKAEVERLRKAGDELHAFLIDYIVDSRISSAYLNKLDDDWTNAAKEGKQP